MKIFQIKIEQKRNFGLDLLRFIAISTVLISHSIVNLPKKYAQIHTYILTEF